MNTEKHVPITQIIASKIEYKVLISLLLVENNHQTRFFIQVGWTTLHLIKEGHLVFCTHSYLGKSEEKTLIKSPIHWRINCFVCGHSKDSKFFCDTPFHHSFCYVWDYLSLPAHQGMAFFFLFFYSNSMSFMHHFLDFLHGGLLCLDLLSWAVMSPCFLGSSFKSFDDI